MNDLVADLRARIEVLEAILRCTECGHLRSEHEDDDAPCFGGRSADAKPGEGEYCMCNGFVSATDTENKAATQIAALDSAIISNDALGDVTLNATTEHGIRIVQIYLGESPLPVGIGDTLANAIDHMNDNNVELRRIS